jgi:hypothetical protein
MKAYLCLGKNTYVIYLSTNDNFITSSPLQLLQVTNPTKDPYLLIKFHNISQLNDKNMLELIPMEHDTKPKKQCINKMGKDNVYLCLTVMMLCIHKNMKFKHFMNVFTNLSISISNPSTTS